MVKKEIEELATVRLIHQSQDISKDIVAIEFELLYELFPLERNKSRYQSFTDSNFRQSLSYQTHWIEIRLYFPGPKLWIRPNSDSEIEFAIQRNGGVEEFVPLLFDNVRLTLSTLGIDEVIYDAISQEIKKRKFYQMRGGYEKARIDLLHPELKSKSLRASFLESYKAVGGEMSQNSRLLDILRDYSKIIASKAV